MVRDLKVRKFMALGAAAVWLAVGCTGGPGSPASLDSPFGSPPPGDDRGSITPGASGPYSGTPSGQGFEAPGTGGPNETGGYEGPTGAPPGSGSCVSLCQTLFACIDKFVSEEEKLKIEFSQEQCVQACPRIPSACASCFLSALGPNCDFEAFDDDSRCASACASLGDDPLGGGGSGGSGQGGSGGSGGGGNNNICDKCPSLVAACPDVIDNNSCQAICPNASAACVACVNAAGSDCEKLASCQAPCTEQNQGGNGGSAGSGGSGGSGGSTSDGACAQLKACCGNLPGEQQASCAQLADSGQEATCSQLVGTVCGGGG